jgi:GalNAc-alpha-(1->4)-GalNAc-alpha-(1->3)-diNAcBac-PP-undecaprenol alpha-1,4-N-acetyl-D-galactosaminyltransferase
VNTIIFISNFMGNGGAARVIAILAEAFRKRDYRVIVASFPFEGYSYPLSENIEQITLKIDPTTRGIKRKIQRISAIRNLLKSNKGCKVISFEYFVNMETIIASTGCGCKVVISERNDPAQEDSKPVIKHMRNFLYQFADTLVCQTPDAKAYFPKNVRKRTEIIPNPIKSNLPDSWKGERTHDIVNFCRLEKQKNLPLLIDAFEQVHTKNQDYSLHIYGDGREKDKLASYIEEKGLQHSVFLHAAVANIHDLILKYTMFVSSSDYEGLSNSMLEAMAIGLPTICTDCPCGGARMVIKDNINGLLTPVGDADALAKAMIRVIEDKKLAGKLSRNANMIKESLSVESILERWEMII